MAHCVQGLVGLEVGDGITRAELKGCHAPVSKESCGHGDLWIGAGINWHCMPLVQGVLWVHHRQSRQNRLVDLVLEVALPVAAEPGIPLCPGRTPATSGAHHALPAELGEGVGGVRPRIGRQWGGLQVERRVLERWCRPLVEEVWVVGQVLGRLFSVQFKETRARRGQTHPPLLVDLR